MLRSPHLRGAEAFSEGHAPHGRDGEQRRGQFAFQAFKQRSADPGGHAGRCALHRPADGILLCPCAPDLGQECFLSVGIQHRKAVFFHLREVFLPHVYGIKPLVRFGVSDAQEMRSDPDPALFQHLQRDPAGHAQRRCQPPGEGAPAPDIVRIPVFHARRPVRVGGPRRFAKRRVIRAAGVSVPDHRAHRCPAGHPVHKAAHELRLVFFPPGGRVVSLSRSPAGHKRPQPGRIHPEPGGQSVNHRADRRRVALPEYADCNLLSPKNHACILPPSALNSSKNPG